jgi:acyl carrier protein
LDKQARILEEVTTLLRDIFAQDDLVVKPATTAVDVPGWDSMKQIEIVIAAEEKYGIRLKAREVDAMRSVGDLISLIDAKTSGT